jgi:pimeloyl-ACP methyl ester carboxylesterase
MFFIEGDPDGVTPGQPAEQYFKETTARVRDGGHFIPFDRPDEFLAELRARVLPFAAH